MNQEMTFLQWVDSLGSQAEAARRLGCTPGLVWQWINGIRPISPIMARKIEDASGGIVRREILRPDIFGDAA